MGSVNLELDLGGDIQYERLTDFNIRKVLDFERAEYSISGSGTVDSELLGAPVRIDSSSMLGGRFNEGPSRGRFAVTGDNDDHAALAPGPETDQRLLTVELSRGGLSSYEALDVDARWGSFVDGLLWWYPPSRPGGVTPGVPPEKGFASALPTVRPQEPQVYGVFAPLRMQFTDRIDPATVPASASAEIRYLSVEEQIVDWPETSTALDVEHRGAAILLRPTGQLKHDRDYMYLLDPASELLTEGEGQPLFPSVRTELRTKATLRAVASSNARFSFPESSIVLNGAQSVSTPGGTLRYSWTDGEVEGSQFSSPSASGTEYSPGPTISDQLVELRLRVTDDLGEYDDARIRLTVFPDPSATRLLGVSVATDDWLGPGRSALVTSATATPRIDTVGVNAVTVTFSESPLPGYGRIWSLSIEAPNDDPLLPGKYEYGNGNPISDPTLPSIHLSANSRSCNPISAAFEVFEIEYDGTGLVNRLAVDYSITCQFSSDAPSGFLRWNSDWPIGAN
jgi:hypothetical protein